MRPCGQVCAKNDAHQSARYAAQLCHFPVPPGIPCKRSVIWHLVKIADSRRSLHREFTWAASCCWTYSERSQKGQFVCRFRFITQGMLGDLAQLRYFDYVQLSGLCLPAHEVLGQVILGLLLHSSDCKFPSFLRQPHLRGRQHNDMHCITHSPCMLTPSTAARFPCLDPQLLNY